MQRCDDHFVKRFMANVIFEIFSEEIPATLQKNILADYSNFINKELKVLKINIKNTANVVIGITLNRIVLGLKEIDMTKTQAIDLVNSVLKDFSKFFPRTMCFPQMSIRWIRPIRNIFVCIDNEVITDNFYGIHAKNGIFINKFDFVKCDSFQEYISILDKAKIEIDYNKRLEFVKDKIYNFCCYFYKKGPDKSDKVAKFTKDEVNKHSYCDLHEVKSSKNYEYNRENKYSHKEEKIFSKEQFWVAQKALNTADKNKLAEEIAGMSEYCIEPMECVLDERFNVLPFELIELVLRKNQRYVVFETQQVINDYNDNIGHDYYHNNGSNDKNGQRTDAINDEINNFKVKKEIRFLIFGDKNTDKVKEGHGKVINARLDDALFYWQKDEQYNFCKKNRDYDNINYADCNDISNDNYRINKQNYQQQIQNEEDNKSVLLELKNELSNRTFIDDITWENYLMKQELIANQLLTNVTCISKQEKKKESKETNIKIKKNKTEKITKNVARNTKNEDKNSIDVDILLNDVKQLIWKTKLDLSTGVVCEFPELQGIIGAYYFDYHFNPYVFDKDFCSAFMINHCKDDYSSFSEKEKDDGCFNKRNEISVLYYYLVDRITYIITMFEQNKQPTGSGDKYKVKSRMDDVIMLLQYPAVNQGIDNILDLISKNEEIYKLLIKRYQKYIEDNFATTKNIKQFAEVYTKNIAKIIAKSILNMIAYFQNQIFIKTYKRIYGYVADLQFINIDGNDLIEKRIKEILVESELIDKLNDSLENNFSNFENIFANDDKTKGIKNKNTHAKNNDVRSGENKNVHAKNGEESIMSNKENMDKFLLNINNYLDNNKINEDETTKKALKWIEVKFFEQCLPAEFLEVA